MSPLEDMRAEIHRHIQTIIGESTGYRLVGLRPLYLVHDIPRNCANDHLSGDDALMLCGKVVGLELTGQGVWFDIPCTWAIRQGKVRAIKEQCPSGLTGAQPFG